MGVTSNWILQTGKIFILKWMTGDCVCSSLFMKIYGNFLNAIV